MLVTITAIGWIDAFTVLFLLQRHLGTVPSME